MDHDRLSFTHVKHCEHNRLSDHESHSTIAPVAVVLKVKEYFVYTCSRCHDPQWYNDGEDPSNVKDEQNAFNER